MTACYKHFPTNNLGKEPQSIQNSDVIYSVHLKNLTGLAYVKLFTNNDTSTININI